MKAGAQEFKLSLKCDEQLRESRQHRGWQLNVSFSDVRIGSCHLFLPEPERNAWSDELLPIPAELAGDLRPKNGFYDRELNAVFTHAAGDSEDNGTIWVFRCGRSEQ